MKYCIFLIPFVFACNSPQNEVTEIESTPVATDTVLPEDSTEIINKKTIPTLSTWVDSIAMREIIGYSEVDFEDAFEIYNQPGEIYDKWTDQFWGRCCTEADLQFSETLNYAIKTSHEGSAYPFQNALEEDYQTAYVFEEKDHISIQVKLDKDSDNYYGENNRLEDKLDAKDTIMGVFQISIINGYVKSRKTFYDNARIKEVEIWLNGEHQCNCYIMNIAEAQIIKGNFPLFMHDIVEIKPTKFYPGKLYDDVCITAIQRNLGGIAHPLLDQKYSVWD